MRAQSALDGFDPNADFFVRAVAVQPDGKILVAGEFTAFSPSGGPAVARNRIARLNPDGSMDTGFNPNANEAVNVIALQADGKILIGGAFTALAPNGGAAVTRNRIARLNADGSLDLAFNPSANGTVGAIAVQADGKILAGGAFSGANSIGGQARNGVARLDPTSGAADSFNPNVTGFAGSPSSVAVIAVQPDGGILIGGAFTVVGGQARTYLARLDPATGLPDSLNPVQSGLGNSVEKIAVQPDGKILVAGRFSAIGGQTRNSIARLDPTTGAADSFNPNANNTVNALAVQSDGKILIAGDFTMVGTVTTNLARLDPVTGTPDAFNALANERTLAIALQTNGKIVLGGLFTNVRGETRNRIARLEADGLLDRTINPIFTGGFAPTVIATAVQPDGKTIVAGRFTSVAGVTRSNIARLLTDGSVDSNFDPNTNGPVHSIALQSDGKIIIGGEFTNAGFFFRSRIARFNPNGSIDLDFHPEANNSVYGIVVEPDGRVLFSGSFTTIDGTPRRSLARVEATGTLDSAFNPDADQVIYALARQTDGKILVGGEFTSIGGQTRNRIARLQSSTGAADSFNPNADGRLLAIALQPDGKILVGGGFSNIGGQVRARMARLDPATGLADSFNPNGNNLGVYAIAVQADRRILVGGAFSNIGGQARNFLARLDPDTSFADSFNPTLDNVVFALALQTDGKILVGGDFANVSGQVRNRFARLRNDTVAQQAITVSRTTLVWQRTGSSAQLTRATFESSPDNVNYTLLGHATNAAGSWTLTGLDLPPGQNIYLRARGYYSTGLQNNSESIVEAVRRAFLPAFQLTTALSRKTHGAAGTFDIDLLSPNFGPECRSTGGNHTLVIGFTNSVTSGNASVSSGTGAVSGSPTFSGNTMTVNLTGVTDVQQITVTLSGVTDSNAQVLPDTAVSMKVLAGDTSGNSSVNGSDVGQTKAQSGVTVTSANFRQDVTANGGINGSDIGLVKSRSGQSLP